MIRAIGRLPVAQAMRIAIPLFIIFVFLSYFGLDRSRYDQVARQFRSEKSLFVADFLDNEIDGHFDGEGIRELCASKKWKPDLYFSCAAPIGGVAIVRNSQLHCIRFAIEAGAQLILPEIVRRHDNDVTKLSWQPTQGDPLDYFFDTAYLNHTLATYCPQMRVHASLDALYDVPGLLDPLRIRAEDLGQELANGSVIVKPHEWAAHLQQRIDLKAPADKRGGVPLRVHIESAAHNSWPVAADPPAVAANFGRILRVRQDCRRLAGAVLFQLAQQFGLRIDPRKGYQPSAGGDAAADDSDSFAGVHLRTEADGGDKFPPYTTQAANYLNYLVMARAPVAYLATGATAKDVTAFTERARDFNVTVVSKRDLLPEGAERAALDSLTVDQRALVDYEVMLRAGLVLGTSEGQFDWNLALRRAWAFGSGPEGVPASTIKSMQWKDDYTVLWGDENAGVSALRATIWP